MSQRWTVRDQHSRDALIRHIDNLRLAGKTPTVQFVGPIDHPKSPSQIKYAHALCQALADYHKISLEDAKKDAKVEFGVVQVSTSCVTGDRTARLVSFADYTKEQMIGFITALEAHLMENSIPFTPAAP